MLKKPVFGGRITRVVALSCCVLFSCKQYPRNQSHAQVPTASIRQGEQLARTYCGSCHLVPDPSQLDSRSWEKGVLPAMGPRLGIFNFGFEAYPNSQRDTNLSKSFYPSQPLLKPEEWGHILDYYSATSPDSLPGQSRPRPIDMKGLSLFSVSVPAFRYPMPATTLVRIDSSGLLLFDNHYHNLYRVSPSLQLVDSLHDNGGIVDMERQGAGWTACNIGVLSPNNGKSGRLQTIHSGWKMATGFHGALRSSGEACAGDGGGP
jgi:hypothetical protein